MANEKKPEKIIQKWQNYDKAHEARDLDLGAAGRGVWLVKVPYVQPWLLSEIAGQLVESPSFQIGCKTNNNAHPNPYPSNN